MCQCHLRGSTFKEIFHVPQQQVGGSSEEDNRKRIRVHNSCDAEFCQQFWMRFSSPQVYFEIMFLKQMKIYWKRNMQTKQNKNMFNILVTIVPDSTPAGTTMTLLESLRRLTRRWRGCYLVSSSTKWTNFYDVCCLGCGLWEDVIDLDNGLVLPKWQSFI